MVRPTIMRMSSSSVVSATRWVPTIGAVTQHGDPVGQLEDLDQTVADVDDATPRSFNRRTRRKRCSTSDSVSAAVGSSMISTLALMRERLGDLDALAVADAERAHLAADVEVVDVERGEDLRGRSLHRFQSIATEAQCAARGP